MPEICPEVNSRYHTKIVGRDRGAGDREKRGRDVYGRREKRGREAGFTKVAGSGRKKEKLRNIAQYFAIE